MKSLHTYVTWRQRVWCIQIHCAGGCEYVRPSMINDLQEDKMHTWNPIFPLYFLLLMNPFIQKKEGRVYTIHGTKLSCCQCLIEKEYTSLLLAMFYCNQVTFFVMLSIAVNMLQLYMLAVVFLSFKWLNSSVGFWPRRKAASYLWWWSIWSFVLNFWCWWHFCMWFWIWWCSHSGSKSITWVARDIGSHNVMHIKPSCAFL